MNVATLIQHHPGRAHLLPALLERLPADAVVVTDPEPDGVANPWRCYRHCLGSIPPGSTHVTIVQDDVEPHPDFATVMQRCIAARPDRIIVMFHSTLPVISAKRMLGMAESGSPWSEMNSHELLPVVTTAWPVPLADEFLRWATAYVKAPRDRSDDGIATRFIRQRGIRPIATIPSLVEHPDIEQSTIRRAAMAGRNPQRVALFAPGDRDILAIDWT